MLGLIVYKDNKVVLEEYFNDANKEESVHTFSLAKA